VSTGQEDQPRTECAGEVSLITYTHPRAMGLNNQVNLYNFAAGQIHTHLLVDIFDEFVEVLVPGVSIFILKVTPHGHHDVVRVEVLGLQIKHKLLRCKMLNEFIVPQMLVRKIMHAWNTVYGIKVYDDNDNLLGP
jgi:hypothetical protein